MKKLIRNLTTEKLNFDEWYRETDHDELNNLYSIKVREELAEIQSSDHKDIMEFVDLIQVAYDFAKHNGFSIDEINKSMMEKKSIKGDFSNAVLINLNPDNPSNKIYFNDEN